MQSTRISMYIRCGSAFYYICEPRHYGSTIIQLNYLFIYVLNSIPRAQLQSMDTKQQQLQTAFSRISTR
jgi:hypothetical protein